MTPVDIPVTFNAAVWFVDRNVEYGRESRVAIECGTDRITYGQLLQCVNRIGSALRSKCAVRMEDRVLLLLPDVPEFIYAFFGAMKIGAVPVPINTLWRTADIEYVLNDSRARVLIVTDVLAQQIQSIAPEARRFL